jgi:2-polyprenyl-3-methyl-5-hydroxy-6-metoxy-1,4-benzoquinol methylase
VSDKREPPASNHYSSGDVGRRKKEFRREKKEPVPKGTATETTDKRAELGHASQIWTRGLERRLQMVREHVTLEGKRILDIGCGVGAFVRRLRQFSPQVYGFDIDRESVTTAAAEGLPNLALAVGEHLPYPDGSFDVIFLHEVLSTSTMTSRS